MKSLILEYQTSPKCIGEDKTLQELEYSNLLNLTVFKGTHKPAIKEVYMETQTFTKAGSEPTEPALVNVCVSI